MRNLIRISWLDIKDPISQVKEAGYSILNAESFGIADCVILELDRMPDPLPEHWYKVSEDFKFSREK